MKQKKTYCEIKLYKLELLINGMWTIAIGWWWCDRIYIK